MSDTALDDSPVTEAPTSPVIPAEEVAPVASPGAAGVGRQVCEFLLLLMMGMLILRYFVAEAYVVPTGSMAPTILGFHWELECPNCHDRFSVGMDESGRLAGRPVCPNCGQEEFDASQGVEANGDRLLVQKFLFDLRNPRRWEVAVFQSPVEPDQAYVKRIVGLPGEAIQIVDGDVWIDGTIAPKSIEEVRAMRVPVFDNRFQPRDAARFPRWKFRGERSRRFNPVTGWKAEGSRFVHETAPGRDLGMDWLEYRHWDPGRSRYGPIHDHYPYNGGDQRDGNVVRDLVLECGLSVRNDVASVQVRVSHGADLFLISVPVDGKSAVEVLRNGRLLDVKALAPGLKSSEATRPRWETLEVAVVDRRIQALVNGKPLFDPLDYQSHGPALMSSPSPIALGLASGTIEVKDLRLFRDLYYTDDLLTRNRRPAGVDEPFFPRGRRVFCARR